MKFNYQARTKEGELQTGVVEASSKEAALVLLQKYGLYITLLEEKALPFYARRLTLFEPVTKKDLVLFFRQLAVMFRSKVPLVEALETLGAQMKKTSFKEKIFKIMEEVEGGSSLSIALSRFPQLFSPFLIAIVKAGEASGKLSESLDYLANHLEREYEFSNKLKGAMTYPAFILFIALIIISLMVTFVLPQLSTILKESGEELPVLTQFVFGAGDFVKEKGLILILFFLAFLILVFSFKRMPEGKKIFDQILLKIPVLAEFFKKIYLCRLAENLSTMISSGLPITRSLEISGEVVGNETYKELILKAQAGVKRGEQISTVFAAYPEIFSPIFTQMTLVGEKTGTLDTTLMHLVGFYQKEIDRSINSLLSMLEPMLIVCLGIGVAIFAIAVIVPVYQMMGKGM